MVWRGAGRLSRAVAPTVAVEAVPGLLPDLPNLMLATAGHLGRLGGWERGAPLAGMAGDEGDGFGRVVRQVAD